MQIDAVFSCIAYNQARGEIVRYENRDSFTAGDDGKEGHKMKAVISGHQLLLWCYCLTDMTRRCALL